MLSPGLTKLFGVFDFLVDSRQFPFAEKDYLIQNTSQLFLIFWAVKPFVKAATAKVSKPFFRFSNDRDRNLIIRFVLHHPMMKDETKLIFDNTNLETPIPARHRLCLC